MGRTPPYRRLDGRADEAQASGLGAVFYGGARGSPRRLVYGTMLGRGDVAQVGKDVPPDTRSACVSRFRTTSVFGGASRLRRFFPPVLSQRTADRFTGGP